MPDNSRHDPPEGFLPDSRSSPFLDLLGGVFQRLYEDRTGPRLQIALAAEEAHCNSRGTVHGGVLAAMLDVTLGRAVAVVVAPGTGLVTVSLTTDFVGRAAAGQWLVASAAVVRHGRRLAYAHGSVAADGEPVAQATAVFSVSPPAVGP